MADRLRDKVAVITGAASGIGSAAARRFAREGAAVLCADVDTDGLAGVLSEIAAVGGEASAVEVDVTSLSDCDRMSEAAITAYGRVDVLYANAGIAGTGSVTTCTPEAWERVLAVNLTGVWYSQRAIIQQMLHQGAGSIINQSSIGGLIGVPGIFPYAAAKAGVIGMTRQAAVELGPYGVRVNAIAPGTAPTPLVERTYAARGSGDKPFGSPVATFSTLEEGYAEAALAHPLRRLGSIDDVANLALFLASDEASWITGAVYVCDGGMTAH